MAKALSFLFLVFVGLRFVLAQYVPEEWDTQAKIDSLVSDVCTIPRHEGPISETQFRTLYADSSPVILVGVSNNHAFRELCRKSHLLSHYGHHDIVLSTANTFSYAKVSKTLEEYINENMQPLEMDLPASSVLYHFGDNKFDEWPNFYESYIRPPFLSALQNGSLSFGMGGTGSGVPFHTHGAVFAEVLHGQKRWFLYPPDHSPVFDPDRTTLYWLNSVYPTLAENDRPMECTLGTGEILYLPSHWWHATLNIGESVFMSTFV